MGVDAVNSVDDAAEVVGTTRMNKIVAHYQECSHEYSHYNFTIYMYADHAFSRGYSLKAKCTYTMLHGKDVTLKYLQIGLNCVQ